MPHKDRSELWIVVGILVGDLLVAGLMLVVGSYAIGARGGLRGVAVPIAPDVQQDGAPR